MASSENQFILRRIHSLLGVIPIGIFLIQHLLINHFATISPEAFNKASDFMWNLPFKIVLEVVIIYIPILFHAIYGLYIAFTAKENIGRHSYFRNWMFLLQRITGVVSFIFIAVHVYQTRIQAALGHHVDFDMVSDILSNPISIILYVIGVLSVIFHFSNGLWSFFITWGITQSPKSQRIMTYVTVFVFIVISIIGLRAIFAFV
nr:succinate dehydrogenase cytochrome b558 subunit [Mammaliicoccus sp. Marseille-Q6498]